MVYVFNLQFPWIHLIFPLLRKQKSWWIGWLLTWTLNLKQMFHENLLNVLVYKRGGTNTLWNFAWEFAMLPFLFPMTPLYSRFTEQKSILQMRSINSKRNVVGWWFSLFLENLVFGHLRVFLFSQFRSLFLIPRCRGRLNNDDTLNSTLLLW